MSAAPRPRLVFVFTFRFTAAAPASTCKDPLETSASTSRSALGSRQRSEFGGISLFFSPRRGKKKRQQPAPESRLKRVQERLLKYRWQAPFERHAPLQGKICNTQHENWPQTRPHITVQRKKPNQHLPSWCPLPPPKLALLVHPPFTFVYVSERAGCFHSSACSQATSGNSGVCVCVCVKGCRFIPNFCGVSRIVGAPC